MILQHQLVTSSGIILKTLNDIELKAKIIGRFKHWLMAEADQSPTMEGKVLVKVACNDPCLLGT